MSRITHFSVLLLKSKTYVCAILLRFSYYILNLSSICRLQLEADNIYLRHLLASTFEIDSLSSTDKNTEQTKSSNLRDFHFLPKNSWNLSKPPPSHSTWPKNSCAPHCSSIAPELHLLSKSPPWFVEVGLRWVAPAQLNPVDPIGRGRRGGTRPFSFQSLQPTEQGHLLPGDKNCS